MVRISFFFFFQKNQSIRHSNKIISFYSRHKRGCHRNGWLTGLVVLSVVKG